MKIKPLFVFIFVGLIMSFLVGCNEVCGRQFN